MYPHIYIYIYIYIYIFPGTKFRNNCKMITTTLTTTLIMTLTTILTITLTSKAGSVNGQYTLVALDELFQHKMGQRTGISYLDAKTVNLALCSGSSCVCA